MNKWFFFFLIIIFKSTSAEARVTKADHYNKIDDKVFTFSKQQPYAIFDTITFFVNQTFQSSEDRARAYYTWIALNISYDVDHLNELNLMQLFSVNMSANYSQKSTEVLKSKKAVCEGYSN
ncbi:MAG: transglutaminase-like domain-containing protein, partial [Ferruginibacter sp.]